MHPVIGVFLAVVAILVVACVASAIQASKKDKRLGVVDARAYITGKISSDANNRRAFDAVLCGVNEGTRLTGDQQRVLDNAVMHVSRQFNQSDNATISFAVAQLAAFVNSCRA